MSYIMPALILALLLCAYIKGADVYSAFISGAEEALPLIVSILPCIAAMTIALSVFREGGAMDALTRLISPFLAKIGMPAELVPLFLLRPFSGGAAMALLQDVYESCGTDSFSGLAASIMLGSTETIFYTVSLYLGSVNVKRARHAVPVALAASAAGAIVALVLASRMVYNM